MSCLLKLHFKAWGNQVLWHFDRVQYLTQNDYAMSRDLVQMIQQYLYSEMLTLGMTQLYVCQYKKLNTYFFHPFTAPLPAVKSLI